MLPRGAIVAFAAICAFPATSGAQTNNPPSALQMQTIMEQRFTELHNFYLASSGAKYTSLLRATLRHARRLDSTNCATLQRYLVNTANRIGYDGLEPVWLVYQDCAAAGAQVSLGPQRLANLGLLKSGLRFIKEPLPQLPARLTQWNSTVERGIRADALRAVVRQYAAAKPETAQRWRLQEILIQPEMRQSLCSLPVLKDQFGKTSLTELVRQAGCLTAAGPNSKDVCAAVSRQNGSPAGGPLDRLNAEDKSRLQQFCSNLTGAGSAASAGMDDLDGFSSDQCASEDRTNLYETDKIGALIEQCYFSGNTNPLAVGGTSADIGKEQYLNTLIEYPWSAGKYGAALHVGKSSKEATFYGAYGNTPAEARSALLDQLVSNPPAGFKSEKKADGSVTTTGGYDVRNADGTTTHVEQTVSVSSDGTTRDTRKGANGDKSGYLEETLTRPDGSSSTTRQEWDKGNLVTKRTETTTDKDGKTTTTEYDENGKVKSTQTSTSKSQNPLGGFNQHNTACQQLMMLDIMPGSNRSKFWDDMFKRPYFLDPRTINPNPERESNWNREPFCGAPGLTTSDAPSACLTPVMCAPNSLLNDSCRCERPKISGAIPFGGCATARCPIGKSPVAVGANSCFCSPDDPDTSGGGRPPEPPVELKNAFSERIWNRRDGQIFVTDDMANRHNQTAPTMPK